MDIWGDAELCKSNWKSCEEVGEMDYTLVILLLHTEWA